MLVETLCTAIFNVLSTLFSSIEIPRFEAFDYIFDMVNLLLVNGSTAFSVFIPIDYAVSLLGLTLLAESIVLVYSITMWVLRKLPLLGIH